MTELLGNSNLEEGEMNPDRLTEAFIGDLNALIAGANRGWSDTKQSRTLSSLLSRQRGVWQNLASETLVGDNEKPNLDKPLSVALSDADLSWRIAATMIELDRKLEISPRKKATNAVMIPVYTAKFYGQLSGLTESTLREDNRLDMTIASLVGEWYADIMMEVTQRFTGIKIQPRN